jgi:hypothetical protein
VEDEGRFLQRFVSIDFPAMVSNWTKATLSDMWNIAKQTSELSIFQFIAKQMMIQPGHFGRHTAI